jgi:cell division protein ZapE
VAPKKQPIARPSLSSLYDARIASGSINDDDAQREVLALLQSLTDHFSEKKPRLRLLSRLRKTPAAEPKPSLYIWGNVGRGKSMLMDLFFQACTLEAKRRVHFHAFMQEVHSRIHQFRKQGKGDPVALLAQEIADSYRLLCFDELQATDVADATLLFRLFEGMFARGVCIVSTSNHPPVSLYTGGVQAERFGKFIELLEGNMRVASLSSQQDYRYRHTQNASADLAKRYYAPIDSGAEDFIQSHLPPKTAATQRTLEVHGRTLTYTAYGDSIGRFSFGELCAAALGAADYLALSGALRTVILTDIPVLPPEKRNEAKRFVTLIDALYENKVKLIATAQAAPQSLYPTGDGSFEFHRTVSRLVEMQSAHWGS